MSDRGGRGGRGARGGDGSRGRGGGGGGGYAPRGDRGGGGYSSRGDRGDRGGGGYAPRGDRGDRGGYRGSFGGSRGDGGFRGGRGGRGGGGGRGGRRDESPGKSRAFSIDGSVPSPDPAVTQLENQLVSQQSLTSQMAGLSVKGQGGRQAKPAPLQSDLFPVRPAFATNGSPVVVWANYFRVDVKPNVFFKYTMDIVEVPPQDQPPKATTKGGPKGAKGTKEAKAAAPEQPREVKGRKLMLVIKEVIAQLLSEDKTLVAATEFKSQLISLKKINFSQNPVRVQLARDVDSDKVDTFDVTFHGPFEAQVGDLKKYLTSMTDGPEGTVFPRYPEVIDALNVILGYGPRQKLDEISAVGSSRFFPFGDDKVIKNLLHNWRALTAARGYFQSARIGTGRLLLNTNVTHGVFKISGPLKTIFDNLDISAVPKNDFRGIKKLKAFAKFLPKTRVWVTFTTSNGKQVRRSKAIYSLATASEISRRSSAANPPQFQLGWEFGGPKNIKFWLNDDAGGAGSLTTVYDYFKKKYGRALGDYPVVNLGTADKPSYFPAEVVEIQPGQSVKAKLTMDETTAMLEFACRSPYSNALSISTASRKVLGLDDAQLGKFGVTVDKRLLTVQARVLRAPMVSYVSTDGKRKSDVTPQNGTWNMRSVRVIKPGKSIGRWTWVNVLMRGNEEPVAGNVVHEFGKFLSGSMGIAINKAPMAPPTESITRDSAMNGTLERFFDWLQQNQVQLVVVVLSDKDSSGLYAKIKTLGDCTYGIHTSCVVANQFRKAHPAYFANVGLKVNLKAGGVNHKLRDEFGILKDGKTMIAGYDVTHPTNMPIQKGNEPPSLVGFVASIDRDLGQWPALAWEQTSKQEMLGDRLTDAFMSRLDLWQRNNGGKYPENIVIFRDGVSEGQFAQVLDQELPSIREACRKKCPPKSQPKVTIVVSVKRHQTRFYPTSADGMSNSGNIKNGTVVDRGITQVRYWDFFLTAHDALQGTARPAHYTVLLDEIFRSRFGVEAANELERLTHELCCLFGRATKAVSICPPAYYADIVCERARAHRPEWFDVSDNESVTTAGQSGTGIVPGGKQVHAALKDSMYYI